MPLINNPLKQMLERVLLHQNQRHDVLSANVANANTPGYTAFDVVLDRSLGAGQPVQMTRTHPRHMTPATTAGQSAGRLERSRDPARLDGNNVSLDQELLKLAENRVMYQVAFELMDKWGGLSRVAREVR